MFSQILEPAGQSLVLTILASLVPLIVLLFLLAVIRMTAWLATIIASVITIGMAVFVWQAPFAPVMRAYLYGAAQGVWAIDWIVLWGLVIFNTLVLTGDFERFKTWMVSQATVDIRIQTLMLAWSFGALLEGLVGTGIRGRWWCPSWPAWASPTWMPSAWQRLQTTRQFPMAHWELPLLLWRR